MAVWSSTAYPGTGTRPAYLSASAMVFSGHISAAASSALPAARPASATCAPVHHTAQLVKGLILQVAAYLRHRMRS
jgi:hypothetical protein